MGQITFNITSDAGVTNTLYAATISPTGSTPTGSWVEMGSRSGPGELPITFDPGIYVVNVISSNSNGSTQGLRPLRVAIWGTGTILGPEEAIRELLISNSAFAALVSSKVYPGKAPQSAKMPFVVYTRVQGSHMQHMDAAAGWAKVTIQVDVYAEKYSEAKAIADKARLALDSFKGSVSTDNGSISIGLISLESDGDSPGKPTGGKDLGYSRVSMDFSIWHSEDIPSFS